MCGWGIGREQPSFYFGLFWFNFGGVVSVRGDADEDERHGDAAGGGETEGDDDGVG